MGWTPGIGGPVPFEWAWVILYGAGGGGRGMGLPYNHASFPPL